MHDSSDWRHAGGMGLSWVIVLVFVGVAIWLAVRALSRSEPERESPEQILRRRLACGEIDREEFEEAMADLRTLEG